MFGHEDERSDAELLAATGDGDRTAPQRVDFLGSGGDLRGGTADQQQVSALAGVAERNPVPNPAPGPGDDGDAIAKCSVS